MNKRGITLSRDKLKLLYPQYKSYLFPLSIIVGCLCVFFILIIPEFQQWLQTRSQIVSKRQEVAILQQNLQTVTKMSDNDLDKYLQITTKALPLEKSVTNMLRAISQAASLAGVSLGDYNFAVGNIVGTPNTTNYSIQVLLATKGSLEQNKKLITILRTQLPLTDITGMKFDNGNAGEMTIVFYYKPLSQVNLDITHIFSPITPSQRVLLNQLTTWNSIPTL